MTRRVLLATSMLAVLALAAGPSAAGAGPAAGSPVARAVAAAEAGSPAPGSPEPGSLRASAAGPDAEGSVSAAAAWRIVASPNPGTSDSHLHDVSCTSAVRCAAVGYSTHPTTRIRRAIVQNLISGTWTTGQIPHRGTSDNTLWNVSCVLGNRCIAVGYFANLAAGYYQTLIATYANGTWKLNNSPNMADTDNFLLGLDCVDATHCVAVGRYLAKSTLRYRPLVLTLNPGTGWQITPSPGRKTNEQNNFLADVSCADGDNCVAVGYSLTDQGVFQTLILSGSTTGPWTLKASPNVANSSNLLRDVSCPTPTECVAVGGTDPGTSVEQTLIERWSGAGWTIAPSANRAGADNHLWGVSCVSAASCVAVGQSQKNSTSRSWTLVETLAAGAWTQTPSPYRGNTFNFLYGVSCPDIDHCWAGGDYVNVTNQRFRTLILTNS